MPSSCLPRRESPAGPRFAPANLLVAAASCGGPFFSPTLTALHQDFAGRNNCSGPRGLIPAPVREVSLHCAIPASGCNNPELFAAGITGLGLLSDALPLRYGNLRHRWESNPRSRIPVEVTHAFATPQTLKILSSLGCSLLHCCNVSAHTPSTNPLTPYRSANSPHPKVREESSFTAFGIRTRSPNGRTCRSTRELRHPGKHSSGGDLL